MRGSVLDLDMLYMYLFVRRKTRSCFLFLSLYLEITVESKIFSSMFCNIRGERRLTI